MFRIITVKLTYLFRALVYYLKRTCSGNAVEFSSA